MREAGQKRIVGLLGVGFDREDGQIRITQADDYRVLMGSGETHEALQKICMQVEEKLKESGRPLSDYSPEEFMELVQGMY
jgi:hypothetical protein